MKIAIVHDELVRKGGAEQVVLSFHKAFPSAPIYTLCYNAQNTYPEFRECNIKTSWFCRFIKNEKDLKRFFFPFAVWAMRQLDLSEYDVILQSTTHCSKYINVKPGKLVITYCHTPFRLVWRPDMYAEITRAGFLKRKLYKTVISILRKIDKKSAERTNWFLTNSREVVPRILSAYNPKHPVTVINPPVRCRNFFVTDQIEDYYLVVARFEPYKQVDLVIDAFNKMPDKKLIIVGKGSLENNLKRQAADNIVFLKSLTLKQLADCYAKCRGFIFPQLEDYGITPLEANASGRPVIAYGEGGVLDTMLPVQNEDSENATAVFFEEQTVESLSAAIKYFETLTFDPHFIRRHAETFDEHHFIEKIKEFVSEKSNHPLQTL